IVTTGQKATDTLCDTFHISQPAIGSFSPFVTEGRELRLYRMPSSSRAYPMKLEKKADFYRKMLDETGLL
ncbi:MAG TPA: DNA glycosylase, partial [Paraprevotella xylaniphila]|nr:DNA glycosylase [Paraprevotella xylaniphila]